MLIRHCCWCGPGFIVRYGIVWWRTKHADGAAVSRWCAVTDEAVPSLVAESVVKARRRRTVARLSRRYLTVTHHSGRLLVFYHRHEVHATRSQTHVLHPEHGHLDTRTPTRTGSRLTTDVSLSQDQARPSGDQSRGRTPAVNRRRSPRKTPIGWTILLMVTQTLSPILHTPTQVSQKKGIGAYGWVNWTILSSLYKITSHPIESQNVRLSVLNYVRGKRTKIGRY